MQVLILEAGYADSLWCKQLVKGLCGELKKRREDYVLRSDPQGITADDTVFVIGSVALWLSNTVCGCNEAGVIPIVLSNCLQPIPGARYHCVCSDIAGSMGRLTAALKRSYGQRIALYGINPDSVGDRGLVEAFLREQPRREAVFENSVSLADCYARFAPHVDSYDAVVCANGFAAVSLVKRLQAEASERLENLRVISCVQTLLSRYWRHITCVDINFELFGKTALGLADLARKQPYVASFSAAVKWSVEKLALEEAPVTVAAETCTDFYSDGELQRMLRLENMLSVCDDTDMTILSMLLQGKSSAHMAESCYLTEGAVKYRIKNMRRLCGVDGRDELVRLLREYMTEA